MPLTEAEKKRLALLLSKATRTAAEETEFKALEARALAENLVLDDAFKKAFGESAEEATQLSDEQIKTLIAGALSAELEGKGLTADKLVTAIKTALTPAEGKVVTKEDVEAAVKGLVKDTAIDTAAIVDAVIKALPKPGAGLNRADLDAALENFVKVHARDGSKHLFPENGPGANHYPIEHRKGNLSVGQKQMLNLIMGKCGSDEHFIQTNTKRPVGMNDGISEKLLETTRRAGEQRVKSLRDSILYGGKALTSTGVGTGDELVPTDLASDLQMRMYLESQLAAALIASEIDMPTNPFKLPLKTTRTAFYKGSENPGANPTASQPGTADITLDAKKLIGVAEFSYEIDEDSIIAILPMLQEDMAQGAAFSFENAVINGDTTATHQDSDIHAVTNHHAKLFKGLRKLAIAGAMNTSLATGGISTANIAALRKKMGKWSIKPSDLMIVAGPMGYNKLVMLDETLTVEKVGGQARILSGVAASLLGMPIIVSEAVREDLNASGVFDNTTTTKGSIFIVHRPSWLVGVKRGFMVEVDRDIRQQINFITASFRRDFVPKETVSATMPLVSLGYNYDA